GPIDGEQQGRGTGQKLLLGLVVDLTDELDLLAIDLRLEALLEVALLAARQLRRDAQRQAAGARDPHRRLGSLVAGQPPQEGEVRSGLEAGTKQGGRQAVMDGAEPIDLGKRLALVVRYRHEGGGTE